MVHTASSLPSKVLNDGSTKSCKRTSASLECSACSLNCMCSRTATAEVAAWSLSSSSPRTATAELDNLSLLMPPPSAKAAKHSVSSSPLSSSVSTASSHTERLSGNGGMTLYNTSQGGADWASFPFELGVRTLYPLLPPLDEEDATPGARLAMVEITHAPDAVKPPETTDYILVLDKSGSMQGARQQNLLAGLRALLQILAAAPAPAAPAADERVTLIAFDHAAAVIFGPGAPSAALAAWDAIVPRLAAAGGTSLAGALHAALDVADGKLSCGRPVTALLLTDGEDPDFAHHLAAWRAAGPAPSPAPARAPAADGLSDAGRRAAGVLGRLGGRSGLAMHFVGVCADADAVLLGGLAQLAAGTYACVADADIPGLMGSLLGLAAESVNRAARLSVTAADGAVILPPSPVYLRVAAPRLPARVPFALPPAHDGTLTLRLVIYRVGAAVPGCAAAAAGGDGDGVGGDGASVERVAEARSDLPRAPTGRPAGAGAAGEAEWEVAGEHAAQWRGAAAGHVARALAEGRLADAADANRAARARILPLLVAAMGDGSTGAGEERLRGAAAELEAEAEDIGRAARGRAAAREASARAASSASTARTGGVSLGDARSESSGQAAMRAASMSYVY